MNPLVTNITDRNGIMRFVINNCHSSLTNAIRRTALSDISTVVIHTINHDENDCNILVNTSQLNNEIIKHRLSCIPIHVTDIDNFAIEKYEVRVAIKNNSNIIKYVTTRDFTLHDLSTGEPIENTLFKPDAISKDFIEIIRLKPKISEKNNGEEINLTCKLSIHTARDNSMYNVVSVISFSNTYDKDAADAAWKKKEKEEEDTHTDDIKKKNAKKNWYALEANRHFHENSFDFIVESVGVFSNSYIMKTSCDRVIDKFNEIKLSKNYSIYNSIESSIPYAYDVQLENQNNTTCCMINHYVFINYYGKDKEFSYIGFYKKHPHDDFTIMRFAFNNKMSLDDASLTITNVINEAADNAIKQLSQVGLSFK
jgi:hypothetical protein